MLDQAIMMIETVMFLPLHGLYEIKSRKLYLQPSRETVDSLVLYFYRMQGAVGGELNDLTSWIMQSQTLS
jgi:hypothetical protein